LTRFVNGRGTLLDLEFLTYANGARVAAFGRSAGFIGMGVGILNWCFQQQQKSNGNWDTRMGALDYYRDFSHMVSVVGDALKGFERKPRVLVIGALGRCGRGKITSSIDTEP
jgi:saccharopine dehydrogenase (NAD+, L-lysine-forming)